MREISGNKVSMKCQEQRKSLNPVCTTGEQVAEAVRLHQGKSRKEALAVAVEMFRLVGIPSPADRVHNYPHQMSGGMRQRVMIAMALSGRPEILIADEPTTALDVTIQAQILELMKDLQKTTGMSIIFITHDLGVIAEMCEDVVVMYAGQIVEEASVGEMFDHPFHPYTQGLLKSMPRIADGFNEGKQRLSEIPGIVPVLTEIIEGCKFADRCPHAFEVCRQTQPQLLPVGQDHQARCWLKEYPERRRSDV